jgi:hypothetical protein
MTFGEIYVNDADLLIPGTYRFSLTATDEGDPSMASSARVEIIIEHAIPDEIEFTSLNYNFTVPEESPIGTAVGNTSIASLTPALDDLVYSIIGGSGDGFFLLDAATGTITTSQRRIDREAFMTSFQLDISATLPDQDPPLRATSTVSIIVGDVNDNIPIFSRNVYPTVGIDTDELSTSEPLLTVLATDMDVGSNEDINYNVHSVVLNQMVHTSPSFTVNSAGAVLPVSTGLVVGAYHVNISASDRGMPIRTAYSSVTIAVQQPAPTSISFTSPDGYTFMLDEDRGVVPIGQVMLTGIPDYLLQFIRYTISDALFTIGSNEGSIRSTRAFDYEIEKVFTFVVTSTLTVTSRTPALHLVTMVNVTVEIVDVNDNTPYFIDFPVEITQYEERQQPEVIHTITANDSDSGSNARLRYRIRNTNMEALLSIDSTTGQITAAAGLDREDSIQGSNHTIIIEVCDSGLPRSLCNSSTTLFRILDINDNRPQLDSGFTYNVDERLLPQTPVLTFVGGDPDVGENGTIRYTLVSTDVPFTCDNVTGAVHLTEELDYEMQQSYTLTLRLTDLGNEVVQSNEYTNVTVRVVNLPDNIPRFSQTVYHSTTDPAVLLGDILFRLNATDADIPFSNDTLRYAITGIRETGNYGNLPDLRVGEITGHVTSGRNQNFTTESNFTVDITVFDLSRFNLSSTTTLVITVVPDPLAFTEEVYVVSVPENANVGMEVATLPITNFSASSDIEYNIQVTDPPPPPGGLRTFTHSGNGGSSLVISLPSQSGTGLDREVVSRYIIEATATRPGPSGTARARLVVNVEDENDNSPEFLDANNTVVTIAEDSVSQTIVTKSNATDRDDGENARLVFSIVGRVPNFPFEINRTTGVIMLASVVDYEMIPSYDITVEARDSGQRESLSSFIVYRINIENVNDNAPVFTASAYFGEVYGRGAVNDLVLHTELRVTDADDVDNQQELSFRIFPASQTQQSAGYSFSVTSRPPYQIRVITLPENSDDMPRLLDLRVEVRDEGGILARVPLYISVFTTNNLATFIFSGVLNEDELLSCATTDNSLCAFRDTVASLVREATASTERLTFFNYTVEPFGTSM